MSRRQRHLNHASAGATMALDARYINQSDNTAVATWASRGAAGFDMSQSTTSFRPILRTGVNGINGSNAVVFNGSSQFLTGANSDLPSWTVLAVANQNATSAVRTIFARGSNIGTARDAFVYFVNTEVNAKRSNGSLYPTAVTSAASGVHIVAARFTGSLLGISANGGSEITQATSVTGSPTGIAWSVGAVQDGAYTYYHSTQIGAVSVWQSAQLTAPVRRRLQHSMALSFKRACA